MNNLVVKKLDYKKDFPEFYKPSPKDPSIINIPKMQFFMIDGKGDPNIAKEYKDAIETLYAISYALKMKVVKKETPQMDYIVPPLEGLWYMENMKEWSIENKDAWHWTMMIRIPDFVTEEQINKAITIVKETKNPPAISKIYNEDYGEGEVVQIMYYGSYSDEGPTIVKMHEFAEEQGYELSGKHHEIYLSDPRKVEPDKCKTIIRQPIRKKD